MTHMDKHKAPRSKSSRVYGVYCEIERIVGMSSLKFAHTDLVVSFLLKLLVISRLLKLVQNEGYAICLEFPKNQLG